MYGEKDNMTAKDTITTFAKEAGALLTIMPDGEHWLHAEKQMEYLDQWITGCISGE